MAKGAAIGAVEGLVGGAALGAAARIAKGVAPLLAKAATSVFNKVAARLAEGSISRTTALLQRSATRAAEDYATGVIGLTQRQAAAVLKNPKLEPMFRGYQIDRYAKELAQKAGLPRDIRVTLPGQAGPDFYQVAKDAAGAERPTGNWWDMTTGRQWEAHLDRYDNFGVRLSI